MNNAVPGCQRSKLKLAGLSMRCILLSFESRSWLSRRGRQRTMPSVPLVCCGLVSVKLPAELGQHQLPHRTSSSQSRTPAFSKRRGMSIWSPWRRPLNRMPVGWTLVVAVVLRLLTRSRVGWRLDRPPDGGGGVNDWRWNRRGIQTEADDWLMELRDGVLRAPGENWTTTRVREDPCLERSPSPPLFRRAPRLERIGRICRFGKPIH
ncbi:hypothetical protein GE09DRAFT_393114 [Coniochaeta sp. 2T2.1]|nr:hypothetical protein GE09DRAFT_393114 [Coniochaeta sp. 2T2.1]